MYHDVLYYIVLTKAAHQVFFLCKRGVNMFYPSCRYQSQLCKLQLIRGLWKLIFGSLNIYLVDNYEVNNSCFIMHLRYLQVYRLRKQHFFFLRAECLKSNFQNLYVFPSMLGFRERCFLIFIVIVKKPQVSIYLLKSALTSVRLHESQGRAM